MRNCNDTAPKVICSVIGVIVKYDVTGAFTKYKVKQSFIKVKSFLRNIKVICYWGQTISERGCDVCLVYLS